MSAARAQAARPAASQAPQGAWHERALAQSTDFALNAWSILKEAYEGFRRSDAFFKYRVLVVFTWGVLSLAGMGVACPGGGGSRNALGARLVVSMVGDQQVYMIVNDSDEAWKDVRLVINDRYSAAATRVNPGADVTVGVKKMMDETGKPAPAGLRVDRLVVRTNDDEVELMKAGQVLDTKN